MRLRSIMLAGLANNMPSDYRLVRAIIGTIWIGPMRVEYRETRRDVRSFFSFKRSVSARTTPRFHSVATREACGHGNSFNAIEFICTSPHSEIRNRRTRSRCEGLRKQLARRDKEGGRWWFVAPAPRARYGRLPPPAPTLGVGTTARHHDAGNDGPDCTNRTVKRN